MLRRTIAAAALLAAATLAAEDGSFEKTIPFPRNREAKLDFTARKCTIRTLAARNYPDEEDIEKARANDPKDTSWLWWQFDVDNRGPEKLKLKFIIEVLDKAGEIVKSADRSVTIDGFESDEYRLPMHLRTLDAADSPKVRIRAQILPK